MTLEDARTLQQGDRVVWMRPGEKVVCGTVFHGMRADSVGITWDDGTMDSAYAISAQRVWWWANVARSEGALVDSRIRYARGSAVVDELRRMSLGRRVVWRIDREVTGRLAASSLVYPKLREAKAAWDASGIGNPPEGKADDE